MKDVLLIALFALLGAAAAGLLGAGVLRLLRHRSLVVSLRFVAGVAVTAMHAGRAEVRNVQGGRCFSVTLPTA